jgi:energy-coupling factor transporter ATP-binding protein EcfA2
MKGNFGLHWCGGQTVGSVPDEKSFHSVTNRRDGCTMVPFLRPQRKFRTISLFKSPMSEETPNSTTPAWQRHEDHVASLYRSLGYAVQSNISVDGHQADLICEKWIEGIGKTRVYVDCKYTQLHVNSSVSKDDVDQFIYTFTNRAQENGWTYAVMLSNQPFTQYAKAAAARHPAVSLKTIDELHADLLHIRSYLHDSVRRYTDSHHFEDYIPMFAKLANTPDVGSTPPQRLDIFVDQWLTNAQHRQLCLLGDFGSGKTTFLEHLHYILAQRYLVDSSVRIPLLITLRQYYDADNSTDLIRRFFLSECTATVPRHLFEHFLSSGRFVLLLDGFDEMGMKSDTALRKANYLKLVPLLDGRSKVIISCRPAHFISNEEVNEVFAFLSRQLEPSHAIAHNRVAAYLYHTVGDTEQRPALEATKSALESTLYAYLELFDDSQIRAYLRKHKASIQKQSGGLLDDKTLLNRIQQIYDLEDLAKRPILLKLIVNTLPYFRERKTSSDGKGEYQVDLGGDTIQVPDITPSVLYSIYTEKELEREYARGKWLLERRDKLAVIALVAYDMFKQDSLSLDLRKQDSLPLGCGRFEQVISQRIESEGIDQAHVIGDIRSCSFLKRDGDGAIRFTHKSFMEYFAAMFIKSEIEAGRAEDVLGSRYLSDEVAYFLGDSLAVSPTDDQAKKDLAMIYRRLAALPKPLVTCLQNVANVLSYARVPLEEIRNVTLERLTFRKLSGRSLRFSNSRLSTLELLKVTDGTVVIQECNLDLLDCRGSTIERLQVSDSTISSTRIVDCVLRRLDADCTNWVIETSRNNKNLNVHMKSCVVAGGARIPAWFPASVRIENCIVVNLDLTGAQFQRIAWQRCTFILCKLDDPSQLQYLWDSRGVFVSKSGESDSGRGSPVIWGNSKVVEHSSKLPKEPTWEGRLVNMFYGHSYKSGAEIRAKVEQVTKADKLFHIQKEKGRVLVEGSDCDGECQVVKVEPDRVWLKKGHRDFSLGLGRLEFVEHSGRCQIIVSRH